MDYTYPQGGNEQQSATSNQQDQPVVQILYHADDYQLNLLGQHTNQLYFAQQQPPPPPGFGQQHSSREILELEHYLHPALVQKSQLESAIAGVDFVASFIDRMEAWEPIIEYKALVAFDLLKLCTVIKDRLHGLDLAEVNSDLLRQQLIYSLDHAWTTNNNLIHGLVAAARSIPQSTLANRIENSLLESGLHQARFFSAVDEAGVTMNEVEILQ